MADDGLLINFDMGDAPLAAKQTFKGGSWKDRLTARKAAEYNRTKSAKRSQKESDGDEVTTKDNSQGADGANARPSKKARFENDSGSHDTSISSRPTNKANSSQKRSHSQKPLTQVVSSLFSFNPASKTEDEKPAEEPQEPVEPSNAPLKSELDTFTSIGLSPQLAEHLLKKLEIKAPTAIQRAAVSQLVKDDTDAFIQAETGSGKTLAYLLPIVQRIMALTATDATQKDDSVKRSSGLFAIVLAPTRELSKQIAVVLESLLRCAHWIVSGTVIGGEKKKSEKARLRKGLNILIATPGRLADHLDHTEALDVSNVRWLVLDEGDRLMDLGFEDDIEKILSKLNSRAAGRSQIKGLPIKRTTILCSATMKMNVQKLGEKSLKDAVHIQGTPTDQDAVANKDEKSFSAPAQLKQSFTVVPAKLRLVSLTAMLKRTFARKGSVMRAIVFISCADSVDFHFDIFAKPDKDAVETSTTTADTPSTTTTKSTPTDTIRTSASSPTLSHPTNPLTIFRLHGSLPQTIRTSTLSAFSRHPNPSILFCTDVAARGLDLPNIDLVIEYDPPFAKEDHLHRIGRTARAGNEGRATIFLQPGPEEGYVDILKAGRHDGLVARHDAKEVLRKGFGSTGIGAGKDWEERSTEWQLDVERWVLEDPVRLEAARRAYQSHIRAYATHVAAERGIFDMAELHLGHLAKAFALRDKPGSIRVPGLRPGVKGKVEARRERRGGNNRGGTTGGAGVGASAGAGGGDAAAGDIPGAVDEVEAKRKMRTMARMQEKAGASEFNIG